MQIRRKRDYHHGELREALIDATRRLLVERGAENFSLADACRLAGVSTAAPYRHFRDRTEILAAIASRGFDALDARLSAVVAGHGPGTLGALIGMGEAYIAFAVAETAVFRLMFGHNRAVKQSDDVTERGNRCFGGVITQVALYHEQAGLPGDARLVALELWTLVHGAASLLIDGDYEKVAPELDLRALLLDAAPKLLGRG